MKNEKREELTVEYIRYLEANNGKIKTTDKTRMKNANTTYLKYLYSEQRFVKLNEHKDNLTAEEIFRIKCYYKILEAKQNIKNRFKVAKDQHFKMSLREKLTDEYIFYLTLNEGIIKSNDKTLMQNTNTNFNYYLQNEQVFMQNLEEKIAKLKPLTLLEHHRAKCFCKIVNIKEELMIKRRNMLTSDYIAYLILKNGVISKSDKTRMPNTNTTYYSYLDIETNFFIQKREELNKGIFLKKSEIHRIECYSKILEELDKIKINKRNLLTEEYIAYLKENHGVISKCDKTRMQNTNTTYYSYLSNEKTDAINKIVLKIKEGKPLSSVEINRLENYYKIIAIKNKLNVIETEDEFSNLKRKIK